MQCSLHFDSDRGNNYKHTKREELIKFQVKASTFKGTHIATDISRNSQFHGQVHRRVLFSEGCNIKVKFRRVTQVEFLMSAYIVKIKTQTVLEISMQENRALRFESKAVRRLTCDTKCDWCVARMFIFWQGARL